MAHLVCGASMAPRYNPCPWQLHAEIRDREEPQTRTSGLGYTWLSKSAMATQLAYLLILNNISASFGDPFPASIQAALSSVNTSEASSFPYARVRSQGLSSIPKIDVTIFVFCNIPV